MHSFTLLLELGFELRKLAVMGETVGHISRLAWRQHISTSIHDLFGNPFRPRPSESLKVILRSGVIPLEGIHQKFELNTQKSFAESPARGAKRNKGLQLTTASPCCLCIS